MKNHYLTIMLSIGIMAACTEPNIEEGPLVERLSSNQDIHFEELTKLISSKMTDPSFRQFIKMESIEQFDGDYDILFAKMVTKDINSGGNKINVRSYLTNVLNNGRTSGEAEAFIEILLQDYPLLQVSIPEIYEGSTEKWDAETKSILVAYLPEDYDEFKTKDLIAYDSEGNKHLIDAINEPTVPVIVIGLNERINYSEGSSSGRIVPYFSNKYFTYFFNSDEKESLDSNDRMMATHAFDRDSNNGRDVLYKGRFVDKDAFRQVEKWPGGRPEFKVVIGYIDKSSGTPTARTTTKYLSEDGWIKKKFFSADLLTKTINVPILTWYKDRYALDMTYIWVELDASGSGSIEVTSQLVTKFEDGTATTQTIKTTIDNNDDQAGDSVVQYEHPTGGDGTWYSTGIVNFSVNQE